MRLQKFLQMAGVASRREAERLIAEGRISVNGFQLTEMGVKIDPARDVVEFDGNRVRIIKKKAYLVMNKPAGFLCSASDDRGRALVYDLLPRGIQRIFSVGRLDYNTEGVLLFTNDGEFALRLSRPENRIKRVYEAKIKGEADYGLLNALRSGVALEEGMARPSDVRVVRSGRKNIWIRLAITEGKYREVRRIFERLGRTVLKLKRVSFGGITVEGMKPGETRFLTQKEIETLINELRER